MSGGTARVDQLVAGFALGDAISHEALLLRDVLRGLGYASDIVAPRARIAAAATADCVPLESWRPQAPDPVIAHYSTASEITDALLAHRGRKALVYHNVTPAEFFDGYDDRIAAELRRGRAELAKVMRAADAVWADSQYNAAEIQSLCAIPVRVFPLPFAPAVVDVAPDPAIAARFSRSMTNILFVGRMVPNKCVEDLLHAFAWYNRGINPRSRLILVGSNRTAPRYYTMLRMLARDWDLTTVCFEEFASPSGLSAYYSAADLFVSTSRHEGFCLPLVEAMHKQVPVLARATGGMPEALSGAGVLFDEMAPPELAALMQRVLDDAPLRATVLAAQRQRMVQILGRDLREEVGALVRELIT